MMRSRSTRAVATNQSLWVAERGCLPTDDVSFARMVPLKSSISWSLGGSSGIADDADSRSGQSARPGHRVSRSGISLGIRNKLPAKPEPTTADRLPPFQYRAAKVDAVL